MASKLTVKSVVQNECCNYFREGPYDIPNFCVNGDKVCFMFAEFQPCGWFEKAVLPAWADVAAEYAAMRGQEALSDITVTRQAVCQVCGEAFKTTSNRQQYCSAVCVEIGRRKSDKHRQRKRRSVVLATLF